jgi:hypothetical protein
MPALLNSGTNTADAADTASVWQAVSIVPGPAADGSNQLKLYDAGSPLLPDGLSLQNVATQNDFRPQRRLARAHRRGRRGLDVD